MMSPLSPLNPLSPTYQANQQLLLESARDDRPPAKHGEPADFTGGAIILLALVGVVVSWGIVEALVARFR